MERISFKMQLLPNSVNEYKKRHQEIWPEIAILLKKTGVSDYSIFIEEQTDVLFAVLKIKDATLLDELAKEDIMQQWWKYMSDITESSKDYRPIITPLTEVFYLK